MRGRIPRRGAALPALFLLLPLLFAPPAAAQYDEAPPPAAWALENVTVVQADGTRAEGMTLVVRGGLIETLSAGAEVPGDARTIAWDEGTLHVYPGIVDAHGSLDLSLPTPDRDGVESWSPTREVQFFTPHRVAAHYLTTNGEGLAAHRRRGMVASVIYPGRGVMPGQPSLILHRPDARTARELVLRPSVGVAMAFQGAQGAYPGTLMAQHAFIRQSFLDAEHDAARRAAFESDARGLAMDPWDPDMEWVQRMAAGEVPVLFRADGAEEIRRVLSLSDELGFSPVIVGGSGAGVVAEELRDRGVPVLLSATLPTPSDWDLEADEGEELTPAAFRERARLEPIFRTAGLLAEHGVTFALTSGGDGAVDLLAGVRRAIEFGLDPDDALRALTVWPAEFLGVPQLSRLEEGMAATFMVTDRPLFDEGASVNWTFVNGFAEKGADPRTPGEVAEDEDEPTDPGGILGRWEGSLTVQGQQLPLQLELVMDGEELGGTMTQMGGPSTSLQNVSLDGNTLSWSISIPEMGGAQANFTGTVAGERMTGTGSIDSPDGSFNFNFELRQLPGGDHR